jgi:hypothetical protein
MRAHPTCLALLVFLAGCEPMAVRVAGVTVPDVDGVRPAPAAPHLLIPAEGAVPPPPPGASAVLVVADVDTPWGRVRDATEGLRLRGVAPYLVVSNHRKVRALWATEAAARESILVEVMANHKSCIAPPRAAERMCVEEPNGKHVSRAAVRSLVRDAVKGYGLDRVHVVVDSQVSYADALRAIDGAATCCERRIHVSIEGLLLP